jgi:hypothetical protein
MSRARGTPHVVLEETDAAVDQPARLGLGDVVEQRRQLEDLAAPHAAAELLGRVRRELVAERPEVAQALEQRVGPGDRAERMLEHGEPVRRRLRRAAHRLDFRHDHAEQAERVEPPQSARRARQREHREELVAHALGGDAGQPRRGGPDRSRRRRGQPQAQRGLEPHAAQGAERIVGQDARIVDAKPARPQIGEPAGRVDDRGAAAAQQHAHRDREGVHREVARGQVGLERRRPPVRQVEAHPAREHARRAALGVERHERAGEARRHPGGEIERARFDRDVQIGGPRGPGQPEPRVANRAADEHR